MRLTPAEVLNSYGRTGRLTADRALAPLLTPGGDPRGRSAPALRLSLGGRVMCRCVAGLLRITRRGGWASALA